MNEEILNGVTMGPDHEKKERRTMLIGGAVVLAVMAGCACAGGVVGVLAAWIWSR